MNKFQALLTPYELRSHVCVAGVAVRQSGDNMVTQRIGWNRRGGWRWWFWVEPRIRANLSNMRKGGRPGALHSELSRARKGAK